MTKDEFLNRKEIIGFINFIVLRINNDDLFNHSYLLKKQTNSDWNCNSIYNAYERYNWRFQCFIPSIGEVVRGTSYDESEKVLFQLQKDLRNTLTTENEEEFENNCLAILQWGGVLPNNKQRILSTTNILNYFESNIQKLKNPLLDTTDDLSSIHMNSGYTKIYSLLIDNFIIYDGRVGAAIGLLVREYLEQEKLDISPKTLDFAYGNPKLSNSNKKDISKRNPSNSRFTFKALSNNSKRHLENNIRANWLLEKVAKESKFDELNNPLRSLETALFMIGYDIRKQ
jgi:hypothetical protein